MSTRSRHLSSGKGFSLVELLVCIAIIATLASLTVPTLTQISSSNLLSTAGNQVVNLANLARDNAMSRNAMTALVVMTDSTIENAQRSFALLELNMKPDGAQLQSNDWKQISKWETLQVGVMVDPGPDNNTRHPYQFSFNNLGDPTTTPGVPSTPFPPVSYGGKVVGDFKYIIFLPDGSLLSGNSAEVRIVEGVSLNATARYTRPDASGGPANYYKITVLAGTGRTKIDRP